MASQVEIANLALTKLGASRITSLTDNNKSARAINAVYDLTRRAELRKFYWQFAMKRTSLPVLSQDPAWGFASQYQLPADFLRLVQCGDVYVPPSQTDYNTMDNSAFAIEGGALLTDLGAPLKIRYVFDNTDPGTYDPLFAKLLACALASEACEEITNSTQKRAAIGEDYKAARIEAVRVGAIERPPQGFADDSWMLARL